jgi:hypothetical protein
VKHGRWALADRFEIFGRFGTDNAESLYLTRWRLIQTPLGGVYLHRFTRPDASPIFHDHPWSFLALVLRGGYVEKRRNPMTGHTTTHTHKAAHFNRMQLVDAHYVASLLRVPTWTIVLVGPHRRKWGYWEQQWLSEGMCWCWTGWNSHRSHRREGINL